MTEQEEQEKAPAPPDKQAPIDEERFHYIGFDVFPGHVKEFWKSDSERESHLLHVREAHGKFVPLSRSNSIVAAQAMSTVERIMITLASVLLVLSPFIPWFSFTRGDQTFLYSGFVMLLKAGVIMEYFALGPGLLTTSFIVLIALMVASMLYGLATLVVLYMGKKSDTDAYLGRVHKILNWHYLPIVGWIVFFCMTASPTELPFGPSLGLTEVGHSMSLVSIAMSSTIGLWIPISALWVNAIKANDL